MDGVKENNEFSPLLEPQRDGDALRFASVLSPSTDENWEDREVGAQGEETKSSWYLFLLTITVGGSLQIAWSVELSNGSPFLLGLGLSKSLLALVWIAGPLSGTLVQPYVGIKSDRCRISWGRRKPFMIGGAIATSISLMALSWTRDIVGGFLSLFGADPASKGVKVTAIVWAVLFIYILDFSINVIQAAIRAFIVDCAPTHQQDDANAWAVKTSGVGNILGYLFGYVNLPNYVPFLGNTQFKCLCAISITVMLGTLAVSCTAIKERDPRLDGDLPPYQNGVIAFFKSMSRSVARLPTQISRVCQVQFAAWIGWFPFLFYITTYIGELYVEPFFAENPNMTPEEIDKTWEHATRIGTFALLIWGITTFVASVILPWLIVPAFEPPPKPSATPLTPTSMTTSSYFNLPSPSAKPSSSRSTFFHTHWARLTHLTSSLRIPSLTLRRLWLLSHLLFFACMWLTFLVRSTAAATVLVGLVGIPWAITNWAPFALISAEISKRDAIRRGVLRAPPTRDGERLARGEDDAHGADQAGVVLGIHNVALAAPQVIATLVSSAIFKALQKPRGSVGDESVAWVLRFGGVCALLAAWLTMRVGEEAEDLRGDAGEGREGAGRVH
ncbi:hypothetical protein EV356DRAFT_440121 [Viridothelium virens]|uniref:MFS general substrate transporter n=1 Tax=Viridothelium virens TaxID=1048519 RepID=A0A6A6HKA7_VIRVR|nr:hypothetical protein EV356DRAFT_440121 [Viridothelium virens]